MDIVHVWMAYIAGILAYVGLGLGARGLEELGESSVFWKYSKYIGILLSMAISHHIFLMHFVFSGIITLIITLVIEYAVKKFVPVITFR